MKDRAILFPTDFSDTGDEAFQLAVSLTRDAKGVLHVLHVEESPLAYGSGHLYCGQFDNDTMEKMAQYRDADVDVRHHVRTGDPAFQIGAFAKEHDIELIVMGTHGRSGLVRALMGSVAEQVVRAAPCPVLTWKHLQPVAESA